MAVSVVKLATLRKPGGGTVATRLEGSFLTELPANDVGALLALPSWRSIAAGDGGGARHALAQADLAPVVPNPEKVLCVGHNYRAHILEMGRELPSYPTIFAKFARTLTGAYDDVVIPAESNQVDWEAELAVVIGAPLRRVSTEGAEDGIAGYSVLNDVSMRDWQNRTGQWTAGKAWEATTPFGPFLVTPDDQDAPGPHSTISCLVGEEPMQQALTSDLVFDVVDLISYISTFTTLMPGDVIATGTPGGVGHASSPPRYLRAGDTLITRIDGLGECRNRLVATKPASHPIVDQARVAVAPAEPR